MTLGDPTLPPTNSGVSFDVVAELHPSNFSLVMATGIVSLGCHLLGMPLIAKMLFGLNVAAYLVLVILTFVRLVRFRRRCFQDLIDHKRGVGFFTTVAASSVLGTQFLLIAELRSIAVVLWCASVGLGFLTTYIFFTGFVVKEIKPSLVDGIHGGWLLAVVAIQSISVLGSQLAHGFGDFAPPVHLYTLSMWLVGGMLYIWIISLIFYRCLFFPMSPPDLSATYWINMGAMAISTLAGATLVSAAPDSEFLRSIAPFVKGLTLLFWATATWWIPMLVILGVWRHVYMRFRLTYDLQYWGVVFPLGMYTVATFRLANAIDQAYLMVVPQVVIYCALAAWCVVFVGLITSLVSCLRTESA